MAESLFGGDEWWFFGPRIAPGDVTYLDGEVTEVNHDERDALVARVDVHMTSQRGARLADGCAEVELPRE